MPDPWNLGRQKPPRDDWFMQTPLLTALLCAACVIVTLASFAAKGQGNAGLSQVGHFGYESPDAIWSGRWWGLLTTVFLHGDYLHILFNMIWLYQLGSMLERTLNTGIYLLFLAAAAVVGSGCELVLSGTTGIGASGVVYAMFGLMWAGRGRYPQWRTYATRDNMILFVGWGVFCIVATHFGWMQIANGAHAGGFLFGLSVGWLFLSPRHRWAWALPLVGLIALTVLSVTWMPWSEEWTFWKAGQEFDRQQYARAITDYQRSLRLGGDPAADWYNIALAWEHLSRQAERQNHPVEAAQDLQQEQDAERKAGPDIQTDTP